MERSAPTPSSGPHLVLPTTTLRQSYYEADGAAPSKGGAIYTKAQAYLKGSCVAKPHALRTETKNHVEMTEDIPSPRAVSPSRVESPERDYIPKWNAEAKVYSHLGGSQDDRYRHIEDLAQFLDGTKADTASYFNDPMQRRAAERSADEAQQIKNDNVVLTGQVDPRRANTEERAAVSPSAVIPGKALETKYKFETTTGQVKPYALKRTTRTTEKTGAPCNHRAMEEYITQMQCQRPTKGVYTPY